MKNLFAGIFLLFVGVISFPPLAHAQEEGLRLITSPLPISLVTEPGTSITTDLRIKNAGTQEEKLKVGIMKFRAYEDSGKPALFEPEPGDESVSWVSFSEPNFVLGPNEWKTITATFNVPETASFGYYYAFVFSRDQEHETLERHETALVGGTAVLVLLEARVPGAKREILVTDFSLDKKFYEFLPTTFQVTLRNAGNVHLAPRGNIFIDQGKNQDVAILEINPEKGSILPDSSRVFEASWKDGFPFYQEKIRDGKLVTDASGKPLYELSWDFDSAEKLRFGKYTAKMLLIYDDGTHDVPIEGEVSFFVIPWRLILVILVILFFFLIGLRSTLFGLWKKIFPKKPLS